MKDIQFELPNELEIVHLEHGYELHLETSMDLDGTDLMGGEFCDMKNISYPYVNRDNGTLVIGGFHEIEVWTIQEYKAIEEMEYYKDYGTNDLDILAELEWSEEDNDWVESDNPTHFEVEYWGEIIYTDGLETAGRNEYNAWYTRNYTGCEQEYEYMVQDYERAMQYNKQWWWYEVFTVSIVDQDGIEIHSQSLGGIESDSDDSYKRSIFEELIGELDIESIASDLKQTAARYEQRAEDVLKLN